MDYYVYVKSNPELIMNLGIESLGNFWPDDGFMFLTKAINEDKLIDEIVIKTDRGSIITIEEFLNALKSLNIKRFINYNKYNK